MPPEAPATTIIRELSALPLYGQKNRLVVEIFGNAGLSDPRHTSFNHDDDEGGWMGSVDWERTAEAVLSDCMGRSNEDRNDEEDEE